MQIETVTPVSFVYYYGESLVCIAILIKVIPSYATDSCVVIGDSLFSKSLIKKVSATMSYVVEMLNIRKEFPGIVANDNITLSLKKGKFMLF